MNYPPFDYLSHTSRYKCGECEYERTDEWRAHQLHHEGHCGVVES